MNGVIRIGEIVRLMPMHLVVDRAGEIISAGPTLRKLIGPARNFADAFTLERLHAAPGSDALAQLARAADDGRRVFLRLRSGNLLLRGHAVATGGRACLVLNLGFGIGLPQVVREYDLTDADFAPSDLAMELLFLHEANNLAGNALALANENLDAARYDAERRSHADPLTGLANRRGLDRALNRVLGDLKGRSGGSDRRHGSDPDGLALAHVDLDHFKEVNDSFGHAAGDIVLQQVANVLRAETRSGDTVARIGGDEFVLLLPGGASESQLMALARRIINRIEEPICLDNGGRVAVSASIGIAVSSAGARPDADALSASADAALYEAKRAGRGRALMAGDSP